jgi:hypothetical protein
MRDRYIAMSFGTLLLCGCVLLQREFASSTSPDGRSNVSLRYISHGPDSDVYVRLRRGPFTETLEFIGDYGPHSPEIYWKNDDVVGIFVCNSYGENVLTAYDFEKHQKILVERVREGLSNQIKQKYGPSLEALKPYRGDVLWWRCEYNRGKP